MKERPILFNGAMVRAILANRKSQTRRVVKPQPERLGVGWAWRKNADNAVSGGDDTGSALINWLPSMSPYGKLGDWIWVREAVCLRPEGYGYRADNDPTNNPKRWIPSIHMPREASRITLEITAVRVERLQDISEADARAEGVEPNWCGDLAGWDPEMHGFLGPSRGDGDDEEGYHRTARGAFSEVWDGIDGKTYPWVSNPWVWVVEFKPL